LKDGEVVAEIEIYSGKFGKKIVLVDDSDLESVVLSGPWGLHFASGRLYARRTGGKIRGLPKEYMHRMIASPPSGLLVDHINGDSLDNRRCNLRIANKSQNAANGVLRRDSTNPFKGICRSKSGNAWVARIRSMGKQIHLGTFRTAEDAHEAYKKAAKVVFGEFACSGEEPGK
jgi:hypothetical protein